MPDETATGVPEHREMTIPQRIMAFLRLGAESTRLMRENAILRRMVEVSYAHLSGEEGQSWFVALWEQSEQEVDAAGIDWMSDLYRACRAAPILPNAGAFDTPPNP